MASSTKNIADLAYLMPKSPEQLKQPLEVHDTPELKAKAEKDTWKANVERKRKIELISSEDVVSLDGICPHQVPEDKSDFKCSSVSAEEIQQYKAMLCTARKVSKVAFDTAIVSNMYTTPKEVQPAKKLKAHFQRQKAKQDLTCVFCSNVDELELPEGIKPHTFRFAECPLYSEGCKFATKLMEMKPSREVNFCFPVQTSSGGLRFNYDIKVCRAFFMAVNGVSTNTLTKLTKMATPFDGRANNGAPKKVGGTMEEKLVKHLKSYPRTRSHYSNADRNKRVRYYLEADMSIARFWREFLQKHDPGFMEQAKRTGFFKSYHLKRKVEPAASTRLREGEQWLKPMIGYEVVRRFFRKYDVHVGPVKVDVCERCDKYNLTIKDIEEQKPSTDKSKAALAAKVRAVQKKWKAHKDCADKAYTIRMDQAKKAAEYFNINYGEFEVEFAVDPTTRHPTVKHKPGFKFCSNNAPEIIQQDAGGNLLTPMLKVGPAYYLRKFNTRMYDIHSSALGRHFSTFWNEAEAKKGTNEVLSLQLKFFEEHSVGSRAIVHVFDNCNGQAKNWAQVALMCLLCSNTKKFHMFDRVDQMLPPAGHTYLENDRGAAAIQSAGRTTTKVMAAKEDWIDLAANCNLSAPICASALDRTKVYNMEAFLKQFFVLTRRRIIGTTAAQKQNVSLRRACWINYGIGPDPEKNNELIHHPDEVWFRYSFDETEPWMKLNLVRKNVDFSKCKHYKHRHFQVYQKNQFLPIPQEKFTDLVALSKYLPQDRQAYYSCANPLFKQQQQVTAAQLRNALQKDYVDSDSDNSGG